jgi:glyoxylase-like metal-dependent hydrolase (beta-lactamase superfamily II)
VLVEVADGVHRISGGVTNFYLIGESGKYTVVDAGAPQDWNLLVSSLQQLGATANDLDAVLLTHSHVDHTGFAEKARTDVGAAVWIHEADADAIKAGKVSWKNERSNFAYVLHGTFWSTAFSLGKRGATKFIPVKEVSSFSDGETIDVPGQPRAIHTPGHTPGSAAIAAESRSALMTGDAMCTWNAYTGRSGPQIMPSALNQSNDQCFESLDRLASVKADVILPGHGDPFTEGIPEAIRRAKAAGVS